MLTKYTAAEIRDRIAALGRIVQALHMDLSLDVEVVEEALREAQDALLIYERFLEFREKITDEEFSQACIAGAEIFKSLQNAERGGENPNENHN